MLDRDHEFVGSQVCCCTSQLQHSQQLTRFAGIIAIERAHYVHACKGYFHLFHVNSDAEPNGISEEMFHNFPSDDLEQMLSDEQSCRDSFDNLSIGNTDTPVINSQEE